jgi:putative ABC transport system permease protein
MEFIMEGNKMKFKDYRKTAFGNLRRRKMRTFLTAFAVSIGTMLIILMVSLGVGVQKLVVDAIKANTPGNSISVNPYKYDSTSGIKIETDMDSEEALEKIKPKFTKIDESAINKIKNMNAVEEVSVSSRLSNLNIQFNGTEKKSSMIIGMDYNYSIFSKDLIETVRIKEKNKDLQAITYGNMVSKENNGGVLIGEKLLKKLGVTDYGSAVGKEITLVAKLPDAPGIPNIEPLTVKFKIEGVINEKFEYGDKLIISLDKAKDYLNYINLDKNYYDNKGPENLEVNVRNMTEVESISGEISNMGYGVTSIQSMIKSIKSVFAVVEVVLAIIGIVIIFVASIGVINTMTMSIYERTRSIGILKALGASKRNIRWLFITESGAIGFIGGLLGLLFSFINTGIIKVAVNAYLKSQGVKDVPNLFSTPLWLIVGTMGFAILISVLAGLYPANKASRLDPVESLRYE